MKKTIVIIAAMACWMHAAAQEGNRAGNQASTTTMQNERSAPYDAAMMRDGKIWLMKDNKLTVLEQPTKLGGTTVYPDGSLAFDDGTKGTLREGDKVLSTGRLDRSNANEVPKSEMK